MTYVMYYRRAGAADPLLQTGAHLKPVPAADDDNLLVAEEGDSYEKFTRLAETRLARNSS